MKSAGIKLSVCVLLIGCLASPCFASLLPVLDFGQQWQDGIRDESLHSYWERSDGGQVNYLCFAPYKQEHLFFRAWPKMMPEGPTKGYGVIRARSIRIGKSKFLMYWQVQQGYFLNMRKMEGSKDHPVPNALKWIQRYEVDGDKLTLYMLDKEAVNKLPLDNRINTMKNGPHQFQETWLKTLNQSTLDALAGLADSDENWYPLAEYSRLKDIVKPPEIKAIPPDVPEPEPVQPFYVNLPDFEYFSGTKSNVLLRHLAALSQWRVLPEKGGFICQKRQKTSSGWRATQGGHISPPYVGPDSVWKFPDRWREGKYGMVKREEFEIAHFFWFGRRPPKSWFSKGNATHVGPLAGEVDLKIVEGRFSKLFF